MSRNEDIARDAADPATSTPRIQVQRQDGSWQTITLDRAVVRLGRHPDNDVAFPEMHVSKRHAEIRAFGDRHMLVDLGSKAGVFVNKEPATERMLEDGDVIDFGSSNGPTMVFRRKGEAPALQTTSVGVALAASTGERNLEHLARFLEFNRLLGGRLMLEEILPDVVDMAMDLTRAERGFLIQIDPDGRLEFRAARNRAGAEIPRSGIIVSETIVREVLKEGEPRVITDVLEDEALLNQASVEALNLRSAVAMPLTRVASTDGAGAGPITFRETFGVLYLDSREAREAFSGIDRGLLEALARDVSSVIENARLLREMESKRRMEEELARAREVQAALLPRSFWHDPHFEAAGSCIPCLDLGGDFLDQLRLPDGRCCFVMVDVSGHGLSAALLAATVQGMLASETVTDQTLGVMTERLNRSINRLVPIGKFATLFACVLSPDGTLTYVNAGHPHPRLLTRGGEIRSLSTGDMALGFLETNTYREKVEGLGRGDVLAIYTDGLPESVNTAGEFFSEERLEAILKRTAHLSASQIHDLIRGEVESFGRPLAARDDVTLLIVKCLGPGASSGPTDGDPDA